MKNGTLFGVIEGWGAGADRGSEQRECRSGQGSCGGTVNSGGAAAGLGLCGTSERPPTTAATTPTRTKTGLNHSHNLAITTEVIAHKQ